MPVTVAQLCDVTPSLESRELYVAAHNPISFPSLRGRAYGGNLLACAVSAACRSVNEPVYELYSCVGHFLSPAKDNRRLQCFVKRLRSSHAFITCHVSVSQVGEGEEEDTAKTQDGTLVLSLEADFHRRETRSLPPFSLAPKEKWPCPETLLPLPQHYEQVVATNGLPQSMAKDPFKWFKNFWDYIETRDCPTGVGGQNLGGQAKYLSTTQDHLPITEKVTADWIRAAQELDTNSKDHYVGIAFALDMAIAYTSLLHDHKYMDDVAVIASLDFTLHFFGVPNMNEWMLREQQSIVRGNGRSLDEYRLFDRDERLVATMRQQSLIRPMKESRM